MERPTQLYRTTLSVLAAIGLSASVVRADVIPIGIGAFPAGAALITFTGLPDGLDVNGLFLGGVQFSYSLGSGQVIIDDGPGTTNNISAPNIVSIGGSG